MLYRDCIEKLLQLKDVIVTNIECQGREMHIWLRMEQRMHFCPCCGTITGKVHDYRTQLVKDISISGYDTILHLRKRRHVCPECGKRINLIRTEKIIKTWKGGNSHVKYEKNRTNSPL